MQEYSLYSAYGALLGAWLGAFVIPLDWDRWWQRYPIPCAFGSTFGFLAGLLYVWLRTHLGGLKISRNVRNSRKQV
jgi:phosphatidylinositol glycan class F